MRTCLGGENSHRATRTQTPSPYDRLMLDFLPRWVLPWMLPAAVVVVVLTNGIFHTVGLVVLIVVVVGAPLLFIAIRHRRGLSSPDEGMQAWRMDSLVKGRPKGPTGR